MSSPKKAKKDRMQTMNVDQLRKNLDLVERFVVVAEYWVRQGNNDKALKVLHDLKK